MIRSTAHQTSLFFYVLCQAIAPLEDETLDPIDSLLNDHRLVALAEEALRSRFGNSGKKGRRGRLSPDRLLRCFVLKHIKGWSFREFERELRANLIYRRFTHFFDDQTPDHTTLNRNLGLLSTETTRLIHERLIEIGRGQRMLSGRKLRTDTTIVEANIHYPTDSSLLLDGIRVLTNSLKKMAAVAGEGVLPKIVDQTLRAKRLMFEIGRAARSRCKSEEKKKQAQERVRSGYEKLLEIARRIVNQAQLIASSPKLIEASCTAQ